MKYLLIIIIILNILGIICLVIQKILNKNEYENNIIQKFDIVTTWVDWSNKNFIKKMKQTGGDPPIIDSGDFIELKYVIRSLIKHKVNFRNIYVVYSDNHPPPKYLVKNNPRLIFVPHSKIAKNKSDLPLIHREPITINLHRIPGLLEDYFYIEDDMFIHNSDIFNIQLENFKNKEQIAFKTSLYTPAETNPNVSGGLWHLNLMNSHKVFNESKNKKFMFLEDHNIWYYKKSIVKKIEKEYEKYFTMTSSYQDSKKHVNKEKYYVGIQAMYINYVIYKMNFKPILDTNYCNNIHTNHIENPPSEDHIKDLKIRLKHHNNYLFSNIQGPGVSDEYSKIPEVHKIVYDWLDKLYPNKSIFEI